MWSTLKCGVHVPLRAKKNGGEGAALPHKETQTSGTASALTHARWDTVQEAPVLVNIAFIGSVFIISCYFISDATGQFPPN